MPFVCQTRSPPLFLFTSTIKHLLPPFISPSVTIEKYEPKWKYFNFRHRSLFAPSIFISIYEFPTRSFFYETRPADNTRRSHHTERKSFSEKVYAFHPSSSHPTSCSDFIIPLFEKRACGDRKNFRKKVKNPTQKIESTDKKTMKMTLLVSIVKRC